MNPKDIKIKTLYSNDAYYWIPFEIMTDSPKWSGTHFVGLVWYRERTNKKCIYDGFEIKENYIRGMTETDLSSNVPEYVLNQLHSPFLELDYLKLKAEHYNI